MSAFQVIKNYLYITKNVKITFLNSSFKFEFLDWIYFRMFFFERKLKNGLKNKLYFYDFTFANIYCNEGIQ